MTGEGNHIVRQEAGKKMCEYGGERGGIGKRLDMTIISILVIYQLFPLEFFTPMNRGFRSCRELFFANSIETFLP